MQKEEFLSHSHAQALSFRTIFTPLKMCLDARIVNSITPGYNNSCRTTCICWWWSQEHNLTFFFWPLVYILCRWKEMMKLLILYKYSSQEHHSPELTSLELLCPSFQLVALCEIPSMKIELPWTRRCPYRSGDFFRGRKRLRSD